jgi:serine/threonine protein kinase
VLGSVWQAEDSLTGRPVTVRVLREEFRQDLVLAKRIGSEVNELTQPVLVDGKLTQRLSHQNILRVIHFQPSEADRPPLIVMESQKGQLLADVLAARGRPQAALVARIGSQLADALDAAHRAGLVHGAPHAGSVLLTPWRQALLMDFGVMSALISRGATAELIRPRSLFLAPEQVAGGEPTPASDVYAVGSLLGMILTGRHPRERTGGPGDADELWRVCERATALDPEARPSAADICSALAALGADLPSPTGRLEGGSDLDPTVLGASPNGGDPIIVLESGGEALIGLPPGGPHPPNHSARPAPPAATGKPPASPPAPSPTRLRQDFPAQAAIVLAGVWQLLWRFGGRSATGTAAAAALLARLVRRIGTALSGSLVKAARAVRRGGLVLASAGAKAVHGIRSNLAAATRAAARAIRGSIAVTTRWARTMARHRATWYISAAAVILITAALLARSLGEGSSPAQRAGRPQTAATSQPQPSVGSRESIAIPSVVGMTAFDAHERLAEAGLAVASAHPVRGTPGIVISTYPDPGVHVAPGTAVTLFVGAPPGRIQDSG